ncbi:MAG: hypothetical protein AAGG54_04885 [Pseudomonadota bacterium]
MTEIADLQARLKQALDQIALGVVKLESPRSGEQVDMEEVAALREALVAEKATCAQLEERLRTQSDKVSRLEIDLLATQERVTQELEAAEDQAGKLRRTNTQLSQSVQALREAAEGGVVEAHLINQAMVSELEGLRVAREGDRAEMDALLGQLRPLLKDEQNA